jgi:ribosomal protein S18 acetylase RimI-like enzyme
VIADSVRLALRAEAASIAAVQRRGWTQTMPADVVGEVLSSVDLDTMTERWEQAILRPPLAQFRVLVAIGDERVVGFAAVGPSDDPDAEAGEDGVVAEFVVDPQAQRRGHGSRLLNACVDTLKADAFVRATWWVHATDDVLRGFLTGAGWAADGAHTEVAVSDGGPSLKLVRLHTAIG